MRCVLCCNKVKVSHGSGYMNHVGIRVGKEGGEGGGREGREGGRWEAGGRGEEEEVGRWGGGGEEERGERGGGYSHESWRRCSTHEV